ANASFDNKNAGTGKTVTVSGISITDPDAGNYSANSTTSTTANVAQHTLAVSATGHNKVYDGTTAAEVTFSDDRLNNDSLTVNGHASFADKNVGAGKNITVTGISLSGADALNYLPNATALAS